MSAVAPDLVRLDGVLLRDAMRLRSWDAVALANASGVPVRRVQRARGGVGMPRATAEKLAAALDVAVADLVAKENE